MQSWRRHWTEVILFHALPTEVRRIIHITNAVEALNAKLRRAARTCGHFPTDEAALKLLFLVLNLAARTQFATLVKDRLTAIRPSRPRMKSLTVPRWVGGSHKSEWDTPHVIGTKMPKAKDPWKFPIEIRVGLVPWSQEPDAFDGLFRSVIP